MSVISKECINVWLTVGIAYSQFGRILQILYDSGPFDFPQVSFSASCQTVKFHVWLCEITNHAKMTSCLHVCSGKLQQGLTVFQSWPLEWSFLSSSWNWFRGTGPSQTAPAVWQSQTISPWTARAETHTSSKTIQNSGWINQHNLLESVKCTAGVLSSS